MVAFLSHPAVQLELREAARMRMIRSASMTATPTQTRTSYWSSPTSPLACSNKLSMCQRIPAIRTRSAKPMRAGAWVRQKVSSSGSLTERRTSKAH